MAKATVTLVTPRVPNFIRIEGSIGVVPVEKLTAEEIDALADAWRLDLHENAEHRRGRK